MKQQHYYLGLASFIAFGIAVGCGGHGIDLGHSSGPPSDGSAGSGGDWAGGGAPATAGAPSWVAAGAGFECVGHACGDLCGYYSGPGGSVLAMQCNAAFSCQIPAAYCGDGSSGSASSGDSYGGFVSGGSESYAGSVAAGGAPYAAAGAPYTTADGGLANAAAGAPYTTANGGLANAAAGAPYAAAGAPYAAPDGGSTNAAAGAPYAAAGFGFGAAGTPGFAAVGLCQGHSCGDVCAYFSTYPGGPQVAMYCDPYAQCLTSAPAVCFDSSAGSGS